MTEGVERIFSGVMARKLRLESEGGVYHVLNRGNYRSDIFRGEKTRAAFLKCLGEACEKTGWRVQAWCLMSNHYHLAVETPRANLAEGMRWLQGTFSTRFNRLRQESVSGGLKLVQLWRCEKGPGLWIFFPFQN